MTSVRTLHQKWMKNQKYREAYEAQRSEFELANELIRARVKAGLSQADLAASMGTTQSAVARIESGKHWPSKKTLEGYARATGTRPVLKLVAVR